MTRRLRYNLQKAVTIYKNEERNNDKIQRVIITESGVDYKYDT